VGENAVLKKYLRLTIRNLSAKMGVGWLSTGPNRKLSINKKNKGVPFKIEEIL